MHYVIGDVHGHYSVLMRLMDQLPQDAELVFVGDLIDRGPQSAEVVKFVRDGGYQCVMGNHEELMDAFGGSFVEDIEQNRHINPYSDWFGNGGIATLKSYGLIAIEEGKPVVAPDAREKLPQFKSDLAWIRKLPLYLELDAVHASDRPVVVSHAPVASVWEMRNKEAMQKTFRDMALWNRREPDEDAKIFNIFGHTVTPDGADIKPHYVNVDTGCYVARSEYGRLSAYCVESGEVVSVL